MVLDDNQNLTFICPKYGVFKIIKNEIHETLRFNFEDIEKKDEGIEYMCRPKYFFISGNKIYVKTNHFGYFVFEKIDDVWKLNQISNKLITSFK